MDSFREFNKYIQRFIWKMNNFNYIIACDIWSEPEYNNAGHNHFWDKFKNCDRDSVTFYSKLDPDNRKRLYEYIVAID